MVRRRTGIEALKKWSKRNWSCIGFVEIKKRVGWFASATFTKKYYDHGHETVFWC